MHTHQYRVQMYSSPIPIHADCSVLNRNAHHPRMQIVTALTKSMQCVSTLDHGIKTRPNAELDLDRLPRYGCQPLPCCCQYS